MAKKWWDSKRSTIVSFDDDGGGYCQYHDTVVVSWTKKTVTLNLGSTQYDTNTTRRRMNEVSDEEGLGIGVWRIKGETWAGVRTSHVCEKRNKVVRLDWQNLSTTLKRPSKRKGPMKCPDCILITLGNVGGV
jgi:hypothetical protein